jgi:exodeoxyribonuclease-3
MSARLISWNINGLRSSMLDIARIYNLYKPDILCLQEIKLSEPVNLPMYTHVLTCLSPKKGYAGVLIATNMQPITYTDDSDGRYIAVEFERFIVMNFYSMNSSRGLVNLAKRQEWEDSLVIPVSKQQLSKGKPVILCGDLNVIHNLDLDIDPKPLDLKLAGTTEEERAKFDNLLSLGFVDMFRHFYPTKRAYSFLGYSRRWKWRLDYVLCNQPSFVHDVEYIMHEFGSDHIPVIAYFDGS